MLATCFLLSSRTWLSACCSMQMSLKLSRPLGRSVKNLRTTKILYVSFNVLCKCYSPFSMRLLLGATALHAKMLQALVPT